MTNQISEYEQLRLDNIRKNEDFLKSIGLYKDPVASALTLPVAEPTKRSRRRLQPKLRKNGEENAPSLATTRTRRKSQRITLKNEDGSDDQLLSLSDIERQNQRIPQAKKQRRSADEDASYFFDHQEEQDEEIKERILEPQALRDYIEASCPEHSDMISNAAIKKCAYRCSYMSRSALRNRINAISRGNGVASREKILVVAYAMRKMGLFGLAAVAASVVQAKLGLEVNFPSEEQKGPEDDKSTLDEKAMVIPINSVNCDTLIGSSHAAGNSTTISGEKCSNNSSSSSITRSSTRGSSSNSSSSSTRSSVSDRTRRGDTGRKEISQIESKSET